MKDIYIHYSNIMCIKGDDSIDFLNSIVTNDIRNLKLNTPYISSILNPKGKIEFLFHIVKILDQYFIFILSNNLQDCYETLYIKKFRSKIEIISLYKEYTQIEIFISYNKLNEFLNLVDIPTRIDNTLQKVFLHNKLSSFIFIYKIDSDRYYVTFHCLYDFLDKAYSILSSFKDTIFFSSYLSLSLLYYNKKSNYFLAKAGIPNWGIDMNNTFNPYNLDIYHRMVSFNKGCYIGQEVIARLFYRAKYKAKFILLNIYVPGSLNIFDDKNIYLNTKDNIVGSFTSLELDSSHSYGFATINSKELEEFDFSKYDFIDSKFHVYIKSKKVFLKIRQIVL